MKERPILFSGVMVRAILDGTKTHTRRVVKPQPYIGDGLFSPESITTEDSKFTLWQNVRPGKSQPTEIKSPYGVPGDRLWVREEWACHWVNDDLKPREIDSELWSVRYFADDTIRGCAVDGSKALLEQCQKRRSALFMPRWASRITLEIVSVRVERLHEISEEDAIAEGFPNPEGMNRQYPDRARYWYKNLWESIHGIGSWNANPWVWVVEFKRVEVSL